MVAVKYFFHWRDFIKTILLLIYLNKYIFLHILEIIFENPKVNSKVPYFENPNLKRSVVLCLFKLDNI